jgi:hypothetical protein
MFTVLAYVGCFVGGVFAEKFGAPVLSSLAAKLKALFKKEEQKIVPVTPAPTVTPSVSA